MRSRDDVQLRVLGDEKGELFAESGEVAVPDAAAVLVVVAVVEEVE